MRISFLIRAAGLCCLMGLAASLPTGPRVQAKPYIPHVEQVPVTRLTENLEAVLKKNPDDFEANHNLARLHAASPGPLRAFAFETAKPAPLTI